MAGKSLAADSSASPLSKWDDWHHEPTPFGLTVTYGRGACWLERCPLVEDWGSGSGWMRRHFREGRYRGIDGSGEFADVICDLVSYRSEVPGIFMRHVLEHNYKWRTILRNACVSFTDRMALVLFTPLVEETHEIAFVEDPGVPDIAFALSDLVAPLEDVGAVCTVETIDSETHYGAETIIYAEKP